MADEYTTDDTEDMSASDELALQEGLSMAARGRQAGVGRAGRGGVPAQSFGSSVVQGVKWLFSPEERKKQESIKEAWAKTYEEENKLNHEKKVLQLQDFRTKAERDRLTLETSREKAQKADAELHINQTFEQHLFNKSKDPLYFRKEDADKAGLPYRTLPDGNITVPTIKEYKSQYWVNPKTGKPTAMSRYLTDFEDKLPTADNMKNLDKFILHFADQQMIEDRMREKEHREGKPKNFFDAFAKMTPLDGKISQLNKGIQKVIGYREDMIQMPGGRKDYNDALTDQVDTYNNTIEIWNGFVDQMAKDYPNDFSKQKAKAMRMPKKNVNSMLLAPLETQQKHDALWSSVQGMAKKYFLGADLSAADEEGDNSLRKTYEPKNVEDATPFSETGVKPDTVGKGEDFGGMDFKGKEGKRFKYNGKRYLVGEDGVPELAK